MARHSTRKHTSGAADLTGGGRVLHWLGIVAMVIGLFAPLLSLDSAAATPMSLERARMMAQQQPLDRDIAAFERVVLVGDFQAQFGCNPFDTNCDQTRLQNNNGLWTGSFAVPPGNWAWELVGVDRANAEYSLANGQVNVAEGQAGVYAEFNAATRANTVAAVTSMANLTGPFGTVALAQEGDGYRATSVNVENDGPVDMQLTIADVSVPLTTNLAAGGNRITFDAAGNIVNIESEGFGEVTINRTDADGNPLPGSCYLLEGASQSRGCDNDDGQPDGNTVVRFPSGFEPGTYTLRETTPADGQEPVDDLQIDLQPGRSTIEVQSAGSATGDIVVLRQDSDGNPVGGACFDAVDATGTVVGSACDEDGDVPDDGRIGIFEVPAGDVLLRETRTPEGVEPAGETPATVNADQATDVPVQSAAIPQQGNLIVTRTDANGAPVAGASYALVDVNGNVVAEAADDGSGTTIFTGIDAGVYTLVETITPEGNEAGADQQVTIAANTDTPVTVSAAAIPQQGTLIVNRTDANGVPVAGASYALVDVNGNVVAESADDGAGTTIFNDIDAGTYTLVETTTPAGNEAGADQQVSIAADTDTPVTVSAAAIVPPTDAPTEAPTDEPTEAPTDEPTEAPTQAPTDGPTAEPTATLQPGRVVVYRTDANGVPVGGACFEVVDANGTSIAENCDEDGLTADDGTTGVVDVPPGTYTLRETRTPAGTQAGAETEITVEPAADTVVTVASAAIEQPTVAPTAEPTVAPTEGATEAPTPTPTDIVPPPTQGAALVVTFPYEEGQAQACIELDTGGAIGMLDLPFGCDNGENDTDPAAGSIRLENVAAGEFFLDVYQGPDSLVQSDPRPVTLLDGETATVLYEAPAPVETSVTILSTDGTNPVGGACYQLDGAGDPICDDGSGTLTVSGVVPGDHTIANVSAPEGYETAQAQTVAINADGSTQVTFVLIAAPVSVVVNTLDAETNQPLPGACYTLSGEDEQCDETASGQVVFEGVEPVDHALTMTSAPEGFEPAAEQLVPADVTTLDVVVEAETTSFSILTTDGAAAIGSACYLIDGAGDPVCDDGSGTLSITNVAPGDHTVTMTAAPGGYTLPDPAQQTISVAADGSSSVTFTVAKATIDLRVTTIDSETSALLPAACYALDGGDPVCDTGEGVVFNGIAPVEHTLVMTTAPEGYIPATEQTVPAGTTSLDVPLQVQTGSLVVTIVDDEDAPLAGACISLDSGTPICDDDNDGRFEFSALPLGNHSVTVTSVPTGYELPTESQSATIAVDPGATINFQIATTPPATGGLDVTIRYSDDSLAEGACVTVTLSGGGTQQNACDGDGIDTNSAPGIVGFNDLPTGTYEVALTPGSETARPLQTTTPVSATVVAGERAAVTLTLPLAPETGVLRLVTTQGGSNVGGACFTVKTLVVCDNDGTDADGTAGVVQINALDPGEYQVSMTTVPGGYEVPGGQSATIVAGETVQLDFELTRLPQPGSITVNTMNTSGDPLLNACYAVMDNGTRVASQCDGSPADGVVSLANIPAGAYQLVQTQSPGGQYATAPTQSVQVSAGEETVVDIVMDLRPGRLTVITADRDEPTLILQNACYTLAGATEFGPFCDADDGSVDGRVVFTNLPAGEYELRQTSASAGYDPAANRTVTIAAGGSLQVTVLNAKVPIPVERGTLVVVPLDPNGNPVAGGCYQVFNGTTPLTQRVCDNADDQVGRITFANLPVGEFTLREQLAPSPDWQIAADISVTIRNGETTTVEVPHLFKTGTVVIQAVNTVGLPLQNACFTLTNAGNTEPCTDATGQATIGGLAPGTRQLTQTSAPFGFRLNTAPRDVVVRPGQTTIVRVIFENQPPPNTGTMQVQKFVCPAGDGGERTTFLGGAQGNQQLKQTAGCVPAVASFTLVAEDGSTASNASFKTNTDGRAQVTAVNGIYLLTETDPDLPGNSAARVRVGTGQMTTVIVINYIAPPAPAPVTINMEGYTCAPGFSGSSFVDFQNSCMANSQLTNQITVRAESINRYKRVTGDTGVLGKTSFVDLPAGTYTIWAERPFSIPLTYLFCGTDAANPTLKAVNGSVVTTQASGTTVTCRVFQVPPLFDATHGAIQVQKYNCPIEERQRGYDYKTECSRATEPLPFEIQRVDPATKNKSPIGDPIRLSTNGDGIVQFPMLAAGTYKLTEVDGTWCFAQSNNVDSQGDVLVTVNKLSEVWIYNCVGTSAPPNTGSGDAADLLNPASTPGAMQVVPNLMWPTVLLAGWLIRQKRFQA